MLINKTELSNLYVDPERHLEFLSSKGYERKMEDDSFDENISRKWIIGLSSQKGCQKKCRICDAWKCGFFGNAGAEDMKYQLSTIFENEAINETDCMEIRFDRNGEPTYNMAVISFIKNELQDFIKDHVKTNNIKPVLYTMMPNDNPNLERFLRDFVLIKNNIYNGNADLILSVNTTDDIERNKQRTGYACSLFQMSRMLQSLPMPEGGKYILRFAVTKDTVIDEKLLTRLFNTNKWKVQLTIASETDNLKNNELDGYISEENLKRLAIPLIESGWDVDIYVPIPSEEDILPGKTLL